MQLKTVYQSSVEDYRGISIIPPTLPILIFCIRIHSIFLIPYASPRLLYLCIQVLHSSVGRALQQIQLIRQDLGLLEKHAGERILLTKDMKIVFKQAQSVSNLIILSRSVLVISLSPFNSHFPGEPG